MKRFLLIAMPLLLLASACREKENPDQKKYSLSVSPTMVSLPSEGGSAAVEVTTDAPSLKVEISDKWIQTSTSGNVLTVRADANTDKDSRTGTVRLLAGEASAEITVLQSGASKNRPADDPYPQADYSLDEESIFVKSDYSNAITSADPATNTFTVPASSVGSQKPEAGQKLIMNTPTDLFPGGLLAKVVSVSESGGNYQVKYENIKLEEAFSDLNIADAAIDLGSYVKEIRDANGNKVNFAATKASSKETYTLELPAASWPLNFAGLEIAPIFKMELTLFFQAIVANYKLYSLNFDTKIDLNVGATIACGYEGKAIDERIPMYEIICGAIPVGPILITPTIGIDALLEVSGKVSVEATATYSASRRYGIHYDANSGWGKNDYTEANKNGSFTLENVSPKVEGTFAYGYSIGPAIAIYVEAVTAGIGYDSKTKHTLSGAYDLLNGNLDDYMNWNVVQHLQNAEYAVTDADAVSFSATVLTREVFEASTPDITCTEEKWKLLPKLGAFPEFERVEDGLNLTVWVKNRNLLDGQLTAYVAENAKDLVHRQKMVFPDSRNQIQSLNAEDAPDSVALKGFVHLDEEDPDLNYAEFIYEVTGVGRFNLGSFMQEFNDEQSRAALMAILKDLYQSKGDGAWTDCNWFEKDVSVYALKHVRVSRRGDQFYFKINIPAEWKLGAAVQVGDHSKNCSKFGGWEIIFEDGCTEKMNKLAILDSHFQGYYISIPYNFITDLTINSPIWSRLTDLASGSPRFDRLDLSYTPIEEFECGYSGISVKNQLILKECKNLKKLTFDSWPQQSFDVTGCSALEEVHFGVGILENGYLSDKGSGTEGAKLFLENTTVGTLSIPNNYKEIWVTGGATFDKVEIVGNKAVEYISLRGAKGNSVEVSNCANLSTLSCPDTDISSFKVENLPGIVHLNVEDNEKLLSLVPEVFDEIPERGGSVSYDIRYSYTDLGGTIEYEDNGYGFWYEGEPECGYHGKEPPKEDEDGYVTYPGDTPARAAFRKVIQDIYRCRKGEWEGCDWLEAKPLSSLMNISAPENASNNETYSVVIPEEWQLGPDVIVKKHNKLPTAQYGGEDGHYEDWQIFIKGERYYNTFSISDPRCYLIQVPGEAKTFAVHSDSFFFNPRGDEPWKYRSHVIPSKIHTLDLRGSGGYDFDYKVDYEHTPKVFKLRRYDGKNLNQALSLKVQYSDADPRPMPTIEIGYNESGDEDMGFGGGLRLMNMILPYGDLPIKVEHMKDFELYGCTGDMIYIPQNFSYAAVGESSGYHVNNVPYASGVANIKEIKVLDNNTIKGLDAEVQESVTVSNCPSMKQIYGTAEYSYVIQSCPVVTKIYAGGKNVKIQDCKALEELDYQDNYSGHIYVEDFEVDNCPALSSVDFERNTSIQSIAMTRVSALKYVDFSKCTNLTMVVPSFFEEVWGRDGSIQYEQRYDYSYGDGPYTTAKGTKFNYTDKGYGFYYAGEPAQGYHRNPR